MSLNFTSFGDGTATKFLCAGVNTACLIGNRFWVTGKTLDFGSPAREFPVAVMGFPGGRAESDQAVFFESFPPGGFSLSLSPPKVSPSPFEVSLSTLKVSRSTSAVRGPPTR